MDQNLHQIKDECRKTLNKFTIRAFSSIPKINYPLILDMGCGTGVPTLALIEICNGTIYAVDSDEACLLWLKEKVKALNCSNRIKVINASVFDTNLFNLKFNIILAEGLLNVIGFEEGLPILLNYLQHNGYLIIHDELHNNKEKIILFEKNNLEILDSFELDETVWWNDYYRCLEKSIKDYENDGLFANEVKEIIEYNKNPNQFRSIYYVLYYPSPADIAFSS